MISRGLLIKSQTLYSFVSFRGDKERLNFSHGQSGVFPGGETTSFFPSVADDAISCNLNLKKVMARLKRLEL